MTLTLVCIWKEQEDFAPTRPLSSFRLQSIAFACFASFNRTPRYRETQTGTSRFEGRTGSSLGTPSKTFWDGWPEYSFDRYCTFLGSGLPSATMPGYSGSQVSYLHPTKRYPSCVSSSLGFIGQAPSFPVLNRSKATALRNQGLPCLSYH